MPELDEVEEEFKKYRNHIKKKLWKNKQYRHIWIMMLEQKRLWKKKE